MVKHLPTMRETQVRSLCWEDPLEKEMTTHSSTLAWKIPWMEEHGRLQSMGSQRVGHDWATSLHFTNVSFIFFIPRRLRYFSKFVNQWVTFFTFVTFVLCSLFYGLTVVLTDLRAGSNFVLAWRIPGMGEPGGLPSVGSHRVGHNWSNLAAAVTLCLWVLLHLTTITALKKGDFWSILDGRRWWWQNAKERIKRREGLL